MTAEEKLNKEVNKPMSLSEFIEAIEVLAEYMVVDQDENNDGNGVARDDAQNGTTRAEM